MENCVWGWSWRGWRRRIATVTLLRYTIGFPCAKDRCISDPIHADLNSKKWSRERVFGACFLSVCMLSQVCCRYCFCIYFFCARRCGALCVHACCLCFLFLASVYPFPLFLRLSVRGRRSSRWNKRRNTLIGIFSVLSLFLTVSEIICKLRLCRAGRWRCEIVDIRGCKRLFRSSTWNESFPFQAALVFCLFGKQFRCSGLAGRFLEPQAESNTEICASS